MSESGRDDHHYIIMSNFCLWMSPFHLILHGYRHWKQGDNLSVIHAVHGAVLLYQPSRMKRYWEYDGTLAVRARLYGERKLIADGMHLS